MSRAVVLPTPGDPFLISNWLRTMHAWRAFYDKLYVCVSWPPETEVYDRICKDVAAEDGEVIKHSSPRLDHGLALHVLLPQVAEEYVLLAEDDAFPLTPCALSQGFQVLESGKVDVYGVPRHSMSQELIEAASPYFDKGAAALWPHALFARTEDLLSLHEPFTARVWEPGEEVKGLHGHVCKTQCSGDTLVAASIELRAERTVLTTWTPPWRHIGSLSTGPYVDGDPLDVQVARDPESWKRRAIYWRMFHATWPGGLEEEHARYGEAVSAVERAVLACSE